MKVHSSESTVNCPFCAIDISGKAFLESENFIAIYNIAPVIPGHSLIISRQHFKSMMDLPEILLTEMFVFARKVTRLLTVAFSADGFDWSIQDGISAGQTVAHLHLHIVPRKPKDLPYSNLWFKQVAENEFQLLDSMNRQKLNENEFLSITTHLRKFAKSKNNENS